MRNTIDGAGAEHVARKVGELAKPGNALHRNHRAGHGKLARGDTTIEVGHEVVGGTGGAVPLAVHKFVTDTSLCVIMLIHCVGSCVWVSAFRGGGVTTLNSVATVVDIMSEVTIW